MADDPRLDSDQVSLGSEVAHFLDKPTARLADFLGAFGLFGVFKTILDFYATDSVLFGVQVWMLSAVLTVVVLGLLLLHILRTTFRKQNARLRALRRQYEMATERLRKDQRSSLDARFEQRSAFEAMRLVYGFHVTLMKFEYHLEAHPSGDPSLGKGKCKQTVELASSRPIKRWSRFMGSSTAKQQRATELQADKVKVFSRDEDVMRRGNNLTELLTFEPAITPDLERVRISFVYELPEGTFWTDYRKSTNKPDAEPKSVEWISFKPGEPVEKFEIIIHYKDFRPGSEPFAMAEYGTGDQRVPIETLAAELNLLSDSRDLNHKVRLALDYPAIGVNYRVMWKVSGAPDYVSDAATRPSAGKSIEQISG